MDGLSKSGVTFTQKPVKATDREILQGVNTFYWCRKAQIICSFLRAHTYLYFCEEHFQSAQVLLNYPILGKRGKLIITPHFLLRHKQVYKNI